MSTADGSRHLALILVGVLTAALLPASVVVSHRVARAGDTDLPSLALPAADDLSADAALTVDDVPAELPETADVQAFIDGMTATIDALPAGEWDLDAVAATLADDPATAFAFLRDRIAFDPYPGVLRGAGGTLAARAGNAYDRMPR